MIVEPQHPSPRPRAVLDSVRALDRRGWVQRLRRPLILLAAYGLSRLLSTALLGAAYLIGAERGMPVAQFVARPDFGGFLQSWDGLNYREIALDGYPRELPVDADGAVEKNVWAFLPLYPLVVRGVMAISGLDFGIAGVLVSLGFGAGATLMLHRILARRLDRTAALWGAILFCCGPLSFLLQVAYAESLFLFLMFCAIDAMMTRRYFWMIPFAVGAAFAHPGALALAAALGIRGLIHIVRRDRIGSRDLFGALSAIVAITAAGFSWPVIAAATTGVPDAYFQTELAWWRTHIDVTSFAPFSPWFLMAQRYFGPVGVVGVIALVGLVAWWLTRRPSRAFGPELLSYSAAYCAYLLAVFLPQQSTFRMLLPLSPLLGASALTSTRRRRFIALTTCIVLQPVAIAALWVVRPP